MEIRGSRTFPFVRWVKRNDLVRTRLYYSKAYIYPLVAAPFVFVAGTNGFLVLHALLLALDLYVIYLFIAAPRQPTDGGGRVRGCVPVRVGRTCLFRLAHA